MYFLSEKLAEASRKIANLKSELGASEQMENAATVAPLRKRRSSIFTKNKTDTSNVGTHVRKMHDIKLAFSEFYLSLILLQNYQTLNFTGFRKILKKHDKVSRLAEIYTLRMPLFYALFHGISSKQTGS